MVHNSEIVQSKLVLLLWKPHWLLYAIYFLSRGIFVFTFLAIHLKLQNQSTLLFPVVLQSSGFFLKKGLVMIDVFTCAFSVPFVQSFIDYMILSITTLFVASLEKLIVSSEVFTVFQNI